ncbi:MAG TPA: RidA family protein [Acidimicrobiales bacterium]|nr:RidA family protein [Acidimicrobiales bacterium]
MERSNINPWTRSTPYGYSNAVLVEAPERWLVCSGQGALNAQGELPGSTDMGEQVRTAFNNLGLVLAHAGMSARDVVRVSFYTTDVDDFLGEVGPISEEFFGDTVPASTVLGVTRLARPDMRVEIEAVAVR